MRALQGAAQGAGGPHRKAAGLFELWDRCNDPVKQFSGGMKRRLEIARGLLHTPRIIFLDEPTLGLDPQTPQRPLDPRAEAEPRRKASQCFLTTHYMEEADRVAQRIAIIDHGKIVTQGTSQELKLQTNSETLEQAFLVLTGSTIREESAPSALGMRKMKQMSKRQALMEIVYSLWLRQMKRSRPRAPPRLSSSLGQPVLICWRSASDSVRYSSSAGQGNYIQFLAPGVIGMSDLVFQR